jgi:hypothetical protein
MSKSLVDRVGYRRQHEGEPMQQKGGGFRDAAFCKAYARSGTKPIPTSGLAGRTAVVETANGTSRMPLDDRRWP